MSEKLPQFLRNAMDRRAVLCSITPLLTLPTMSTLTGCSTLSTSTIRYRMVVELNTSEGIRTGSSIIESFMRDGPRMAEAGGVSYSLRGEAVEIRLHRGIFFALLGQVGQGSAADYFAHILPRALARRESHPPLSRRYAGGEWKAQREEFLRKQAKILLDEEDYPTFATFHNILDPRSIVEVNIENIKDEFGEAVSIKRIFLQATADDVTSGIKKTLPWIDTIRGKYLNGATSENLSSPFSGRVGSDNVSVGVCK